MKVTNPIFKVDMPDPDVIRVDDIFYMVSTTMFFMPGGAILKSKDLVNWELCSYIFDKIIDNDIYELKNGCHAYGKGQWATSLIWHNNKYYACFVCHDLKKTFIYSTDDIEKSYWDRIEIDDAFHDMSFLFINNTPYLIYGNGDIKAVQLKEDLSGVEEEGLHKTILSTPTDGMRLRCEGCRAYNHDGYIYLSFIDIPDNVVGNGKRRQIVYRSKSLEGPYERQIILDDDFSLEKRGVAQGPFIEDGHGNWYAMLFQDRGSCGRMPLLMPLTWVNGWPVLGTKDHVSNIENFLSDDNFPMETDYLGKVPREFEIDFPGSQAVANHGSECVASPFITSDIFDDNKNLNIQWQWNHNPIEQCYTYLNDNNSIRLITGQLATNLLDARNTLTERTTETKCEFSVNLDFSNLKDGDFAGLCAFMSQYGQIGIKKKDNEFLLYYIRRNKDHELIEKCQPVDCTQIYLKICFNFENLIDEADFYYSFDGKNYEKFDDTLKMEYTLDLFVGYRIGLFNYATKELGGYADFTEFTSLL